MDPATRPLLALFAALSIGCGATSSAPPPEPPPPPKPRENPRSYDYSWKVPGDPGPSNEGLAVAIVKPDYGEAAGVHKDPRYKRFVQGFSKSIAADLDAALVAKGIKVLGPFETYDDITYQEKKTAHFALTPRVVFSVAAERPQPSPQAGNPNRTVGKEAEYLAGRGGRVTRSRQPGFITAVFELTIQGQVVFELCEPLSKQKLWVKRLALEPKTWGRLGDQYEFLGAFNQRGTLTGWERGELLYNAKEHALVSYMQARYPDLLGKFWKYLDAGELRALKAQVDEIRGLKRY